jgi:hypothetical protein
MKMEQEAIKATELANVVGEALDGQNMSVVMTVLSRLYIQSAIELGMPKSKLMEACSVIYDLLSDNSDEVIH